MFNFFLAGVQYLEGAGDYLSSVLDENTSLPVVLFPEVDNPVDPYAIKVLLDGRHIGYVPNNGRTCVVCLEPIGRGATSCLCGSKKIVESGLAYRIRRLLDAGWTMEAAVGIDPSTNKKAGTGMEGAPGYRVDLVMVLPYHDRDSSGEDYWG